MDSRRIGIRFPVFILTYVYSDACHFTSLFQITTKLAAAIFAGALYGGGVLLAQYVAAATRASELVSISRDSDKLQKSCQELKMQRCQLMNAKPQTSRKGASGS